MGKMASIGHEKLRQDVREIISTADLSALSAKKIRRQLEEKYDADLTDRKKEVDDIIMEMVKERQDKEKKSSESDSEEDMKGGSKNGDSQSDAESDFEEPEYSPPRKKAKASKQVDDEELAKQLQEEEENSVRKTRGGRSKPAPKKKTGGGPKGKSGYAKPCQLSPALAAVMGKDEMARSDVVKRMWEIVRERNLLDPKNKQFMLCDDELLKIFGRKRVRTFGMMKYLKDHIFKMGELENM